MTDNLAKLREPFPAHQISKLPKPTKAQNDCPNDQKVNCKICGGWHHPKVIHLDYVGHAALTDRLLDTDPQWYWEPMATIGGLPAFDQTGGLWIRLHVCGHSRIGYGHAAASAYKEIGSREKEVIGDALRNAAMRFGAALELWHKGDLHKEEPEPADEPGKLTQIYPWSDEEVAAARASVADLADRIFNLGASEKEIKAVLSKPAPIGDEELGYTVWDRRFSGYAERVIKTWEAKAKERE